MIDEKHKLVAQIGQAWSIFALTSQNFSFSHNGEGSLRGVHLQKSEIARETDELEKL